VQVEHSGQRGYRAPVQQSQLVLWRNQFNPQSVNGAV
jgi:hypothetical protein